MKDKLASNRVEQLMTVSPFSISQDETLGEAEKVMQKKGIRHLPVTKKDKTLVGLVSHRDLLRFSISELSEVSQLDRNICHAEIFIGEVMQSDVRTVEPTTSLRTAAILMAEHKYGCLPVTVNGKLVGILTESDFLKFCAENA